MPTADKRSSLSYFNLARLYRRANMKARHVKRNFQAFRDLYAGKAEVFSRADFAQTAQPFLCIVFVHLAPSAPPISVVLFPPVRISG